MAMDVFMLPFFFSLAEARFCHDDGCNAAISLQTPVRFCRGG